MHQVKGLQPVLRSDPGRRPFPEPAVKVLVWMGALFGPGAASLRLYERVRECGFAFFTAGLIIRQKCSWRAVPACRLLRWGWRDRSHLLRLGMSVTPHFWNVRRPMGAPRSGKRPFPLHWRAKAFCDYHFGRPSGNLEDCFWEGLPSNGSGQLGEITQQFAPLLRGKRRFRHYVRKERKQSRD